MAKFLPNAKISIDDNNKKKYVEFSVETQIEFEEHETNIEWELIVKIYDKNRENEDDFITTITRILKPKKLKIEQKIREKIERENLKIDMSKAEVAFKLEINPKQT